MTSKYEKIVSEKYSHNEVLIETESTICEVVNFSENSRGIIYNKLYLDNFEMSNEDEELFNFVFKGRYRPFYLPNMMSIEIKEPIEFLDFDKYL